MEPRCSGPDGDGAKRQQQPLRPRVEGHLQRLGEILNRHDVPAQTHAPEHDELLLERAGEDARAQCHERRQSHGRRRACVMQLDDVQVVVVVTGFHRGADPAAIGLEVVKADLDRLFGAAVRAEA